HFKQEVDQLITHFLEDDGQELMAKILPKLEKISNEYEEAYGNPRNEPTYFEQKLYGKNGLYSRIGNLILQEAKNHPELRQKKKGAGGFRESDLDWRPEPSEDTFTKPADEFLSLDTTVPTEIAVEETTNLSLEPLPQEVPSTSPSIRSSKEQQIDTKMEQSIDRLQQYFHQNKERLDKRNQEYFYKESLSKINGKVEKRGMHIRQVEGSPYSEPASIFMHDKLAKEILLTDSDYTELHTLHEN
ncbi:relaxase MobL, partial [Enterococcus faecalis]